MKIGDILKERGMQLTLDHAGEDWRVQAIDGIREWRDKTARTGKLYAFEEIKQHLVENGLRNPPHVNAWGAIAKAAIKQKLIEGTGLFRTAKSPSAHSRVVRLYRVVR